MSATHVVSPQLVPVPQTLREQLPSPSIPWMLSQNLFARMHNKDETSPPSYRQTQILQDDPEWRFILEFFQHDKPHKYEIKAAYGIHNRRSQQTFEGYLSIINAEAQKLLPSWQQEPQADQRKTCITRWKTSVQNFSPFKIKETDGREELIKHAKVLPLWHGSSQQVCKSIAGSGFTFFGKTSLAKTTKDPVSTDEGFFGSGIYFTNSARYAADIYSKGHLIVSWVSMREPFPVINGDMDTLKGKGAYKHYNAHYVPVRSINPTNPNECLYFPCKQGEKPHCDEIVVFNAAQALPRFWVELEVAAPNLIQLPMIMPTKKGLSIKIMCKNNQCTEFNKEQWVGKGIGKFNMNQVFAEMACQGCSLTIGNENISTTDIYFSNCKGSYTGMYKEDDSNQIIKVENKAFEVKANQLNSFETKPKNWVFVNLEIFNQ
ncbi:MAG: hypothetical protein KDK71_08000 [Chlamydiia bacterium]|nr:hypothetical protein [Chlamydiia bacterium]